LLGQLEISLKTKCQTLPQAACWKPLSNANIGSKRAKNETEHFDIKTPLTTNKHHVVNSSIQFIDVLWHLFQQAVEHLNSVGEHESAQNLVDAFHANRWRSWGETLSAG
jgi:hypothetical protein